MRVHRTALVLITLQFLNPVQRAHGAEITADFDSVPTQIFQRHNYEEAGFRFSPCSDFAITDYNPVYPAEPPSPEWQGYEGTQFFSFQNAGPNPEYLGDEDCSVGTSRQGLLYIDNSGRPFSLVSFYGILVNRYMEVYSSKGGYLQASQILLPGDPPCGSAIYWCPTILDFSGPDWTGIKWLKFVAGNDIYTGFDHITFRAGVPEPGTFALFTVGLVSLGLSRRRKTR